MSQYIGTHGSVMSQTSDEAKIAATVGLSVTSPLGMLTGSALIMSLRQAHELSIDGQASRRKGSTRVVQVTKRPPHMHCPRIQRRAWHTPRSGPSFRDGSYFFSSPNSRA